MSTADWPPERWEGLIEAGWNPEDYDALYSEDKPPVPLGAVLLSAIEFSFAAFANRGRARDPVLSSLPYGDYLRTTHWMHLRRRKLAVAGYKCARCDRADVRLDVHHWTYDRLGRECDSDLVVLCGGCHAAEHDLSGDRPPIHRPAP